MEQTDKGPRQHWQREAEPVAARSPLDTIYHQRAHLRILIKHHINAAPPQKTSSRRPRLGRVGHWSPSVPTTAERGPAGGLTAMGWCEKMLDPCVCVCVSDDEPPL